MKTTKNLGNLLLAIYLIAIGVIQVLGINLGALSLAVPILAIVAGVLVLLGK